MPTIATIPGRPRSRARCRAAVVLVALVLAGCGSSGGDDANEPPPAEGKSTTTTEPKATTTSAAVDDEPTSDGTSDGLPTTEADAPSGDWISVRFLVAIEPEPDDIIKGSAEARLYDIEPDCSGGDACSLVFSPGGDDGSFALPGTEPIKGEAVTLEPDGGEWTDSYSYPDAVGCTDELDGPYLDTSEERTMAPVHDDDGDLTGLVGTVLFTDTLTAAGRAAGCPASSEATYAYVIVAAPNDGIADIDGYEVDGRFSQTLEVTGAANQMDPMFQKGGISTTFSKYDAEMAGSCEDGECSVEFAQLNGDDLMRRAELVSEDGRSLLGTYEEGGGCTDPDTGEVVFEEGAYRTTGAYEDLTPIWVEDGEVKAFVGKFYRSTEPTDLGETDPACSEPESLEAWVYLVDTDVLG